jgi:hypothetical protein
VIGNFQNKMGFILFIIAYLLYWPLTLINYFVVENKKGYFRSSAITIDKLANREFRTLWNKTLKKENGYKFGSENETISSALGKNQRDNTLTKTGEKLVWLLDKIEKNHCLISINN